MRCVSETPIPGPGTTSKRHLPATAHPIADHPLYRQAWRRLLVAMLAGLAVVLGMPSLPAADATSADVQALLESAQRHLAAGRRDVANRLLDAAQQLMQEGAAPSAARPTAPRTPASVGPRADRVARPGELRTGTSGLYDPNEPYLHRPLLPDMPARSDLPHDDYLRRYWYGDFEFEWSYWQEDSPTPTPDHDRPNKRDEVYLTLTEAIELAVQNNLDLEAFKIADRRAEWDVQEAYSRFDPELTAQLAHQVNRAPTGNFNYENTTAEANLLQRLPWGTELNLTGTENEIDSINSPSLRLGVIQPLWQGAGTDSTYVDIRKTKIQQLVSRGNLEVAAQQLVYDVRSIYLNCARLRQLQAVNRESIRQAEDFLAQVKVRAEAGNVIALDLLNAEVNLANRQLDEVSTQRELEAALDNLKQLLNLDMGERLVVEADAALFGDEEEEKIGGRPLAIVVDPDTQIIRLALPPAGGEDVREEDWETVRTIYRPVAHDPGLLLRVALDNRVDLINMRRRIAVSKLEVMFREDSLGHQLDLFGHYSRLGADKDFSDAHNLDGDEFEVGLRYRLPWGKRFDKARHQRALLDLEEATLNLKRQYNRIESQVRDVLRRLRETSRSLTIQAVRIERAKGRVDQSEVNFERGLRDSFDVVNTHESLHRAKLEFLNSRQLYLAQLAELDLVTGRRTGRVSLDVDNPSGQVESELPPELLERGLPARAPLPEPTEYEKPVRTQLHFIDNLQTP